MGSGQARQLGAAALAVLTVATAALALASLATTAPPAGAHPAQGENEAEAGVESHLTVRTVVDVTVAKVPIDWGALSSGTENNPALENKGFPSEVTVTSATNTLVDVYIKGTGWSDGAGKTIGAENCTYDDDSALGENAQVEQGRPENTLATTYPGAANQGYFEGVAPSTMKQLYFWVDVPAGQWAGDYSGTVYVKVVKDGFAP